MMSLILRIRRPVKAGLWCHLSSASIINTLNILFLTIPFSHLPTVLVQFNTNGIINYFLTTTRGCYHAEAGRVSNFTCSCFCFSYSTMLHYNEFFIALNTDNKTPSPCFSGQLYPGQITVLLQPMHICPRNST